MRSCQGHLGLISRAFDARSSFWLSGTFAIGTEAFVIGGVLPAVARSLGVSTSSAGLLVTAFAIAYAIGGPVLAVGSARHPRRALMVSALAPFVAANILAAVAPGYAMMMIGRGFAALGAAAFVPAASAVASSLAPTEYRGRPLGTVVAGMTVAQVVGVPFGAFVGASLEWRYTFIFVAALGRPQLCQCDSGYLTSNRQHPPGLAGGWLWLRARRPGRCCCRPPWRWRRVSAS